MLPKPIAHWILGHVSRETLTWIVGIFFLMPMAIIPIVVVTVMFVGLRKARPTPKTGIVLTRIGNMILASLFFLGMIWPDDWMLVSSPPPPATLEPRPFFATMAAWLICVWFISGVFLFFRTRLAWFGSLIGVCLAVVIFAWLFTTVFGECFFPNAQELHDRERLIGGAPSVVIIYTFAFGFIGICLASAVGLFIGLLKMRGESR